MPPRPTPTRLVFTGFAIAYIFGAAGYLFYGFVNDTGPSGWMDTWQMEHLGTAHRSLTQVGNILLWVLGLVPIFWLLGKLNRKENFVPQMPAPRAEWPLRSRLITAGVVLAIAGAAYTFIVQRDAHLAKQPVGQFDLSQTQTLPPDAELANVRGVVAANYSFVVVEKGNGRTPIRNSYVPLLPASWQPSQPVRYVLKTQALAYADPRTHQVAWLDSGRAFIATYDGRLSANDLPTFVKEDYAQQNLTLASPYYVLDDEAVYDGHAVLSSELTRWMILGGGLVFAVLLVVRRGYR